MASSVLATLAQLRLVPVIELQNADHAAPLAHALIAGGLPVAEVTFRSAAAPESLRRMAAIPGVCLGAGTIINVDQAKQAIDCGAQYLVSPGCSGKVIDFARSQNIPIFPGIATPTDIILAIDHGVEIVKFFPAETYGGVKALQSLSAPFPQIKFVPTGGINATNLASYLALSRVVACGGSWMVEKSLIAAGNFAEITRRSAEAIKLVQPVA
jgi:2-dehydro-3-deoxyphosphogluconate aldolase / (4S)-4-hydroxy-2-oxoglutarate aldolase